ncbi:beta strand repeat-containing protein, partial [Salinivirga cyanobacteriivorans]
MMNDFTLHTQARKLFVFIVTVLLSFTATGQTVLFSEDFEEAGSETYTTNQANITVLSNSWEYEKTNRGRLRLGEYAQNGSNAATLDAEQDGNYSYNYITATIDLGVYKNSAALLLSFSYMDHGDESNADDVVQVRRGDDSDGNNWINVYNLDPANTTNGTWNAVTDLKISPLLADQNSSSTLIQVRFLQYDNYRATSSTEFDGITFDDIQLTGLEAPSGNLTDLVYWLRGDLGVTGATPITEWADLSGNGNNATPDSNGPDQVTSANMNNQQVMNFDGNDDLNIANDARINGGSGYDGSERTMFMAFQTSADITTTQYIYEEGGGVNGIGVYIKNGNLYLNIYNDNASNRITLHETINANTTYILSFNWDIGAFSGYLNNIPFSNQTSNGGITNLKQHTGDISIGFTGGGTRDENGNNVNGGQNFTGEIGEILYYDASLLEEEVLDISLELADRYGISFDPVTTYYSYQTGNWDAFSTWTHDPGGTTQTATDIPGDNDQIVILSGRTVTLTGNVTTSNNDITIRAGGTLDQATSEFTNTLLALRGSGTHKLASVNYPDVSTNEFVDAEGGTTEYYNAADFTLPTAQTEYNNLRINAPGVTATQLSNITLNGNLHVKQGTYQINDNSANRRQLTINGNVLVDNGASITTGTGNTVSGDESGGTAPFTDYYDKNSHRVVVYGDFTNNGTVKFTNQSYPEYNAFPTDGMATVYFMGATSNTLTANGTSDFYNLVLDKGIDKTYKLTVYSTDYSNFRLFGRNNIGGQNPGPNPDLRKALWIRTGTLELKGLTVIPSLVEGTDCGSSPNSDYYIPANGALVLNGPEVIVLTTADTHEEINLAYGVSASNDGDCGVATGGCTSFSILGKLQVNDGYFSTRESGGIITWDDAAGELIINGGIVDVKQYRSAGSSGGLASFTQSGGTFLLRGRFQRTPSAFSAISDLKDFSASTLNTARVTDGLQGSLGTFNINEPANVFAMSGGTIRIYDVCGTGDSEAFQVFSDEANNSVTGGTLEIIPTTGTGTDATEFNIESKAPLGNLSINRASSSASVDLNNHNLVVLNDVTITSGDFNANNLDLTIGGDFTLASGTSYTPGTNTTTFNGTNNQQLTINLASVQDFNNFTLNNRSGNKLTISGTQNTININNTLTIQKGELADNGKTINVTGDVYNAGTHSGDGKIVLSGSADQAINGSGNGVFGNIELNNTSGSTAPVSLEANATINGTLTFSQDKLFDISSHKLTFGQTATVTNAGTDRFIRTAGNAGDGGVTKTYTASATSFTFPVGTISTSHAAAEYTPASLSFGTNPNTFG